MTTRWSPSLPPTCWAAARRPARLRGRKRSCPSPTAPSQRGARRRRSSPRRRARVVRRTGVAGRFDRGRWLLGRRRRRRVRRRLWRVGQSRRLSIARAATWRDRSLARGRGPHARGRRPGCGRTASRSTARRARTTRCSGGRGAATNSAPGTRKPAGAASSSSCDRRWSPSPGPNAGSSEQCRRGQPGPGDHGEIVFLIADR